MGKYTGPKHKLARREGVNIIDKTSASLQRRLNIPPGQHARKRKKRLSEYGLQLREKQKAKFAYMLRENQFKKLFQKVVSQKAETGELLISLLETRLDNLVYRLGFAKSRFMARQLVSHGHVVVNGKKITIPSYNAKVDDVITLSPKFMKHLETSEKDIDVLPFLQKEGPVGKLMRMPKKEDVQVPFDVQLIIEYYSR